MKLLKIEFQNLNSLAGIYSIDLSVPEYNGVFAITGLTGSGKSTILDAVSLACYGRTPREKKGTPASEREILTKNKTKGFSKVTFESGGDIYIARFDIHRSRNKKSGIIRDPLYRVWKNGVLICDKKQEFTGKNSSTPGIMERITGMDFEQFSKTVILPQGAFQEFLDARDDDKVKILERLTKTDRYRQYSSKAYEIYNNMKSEIDRKLADLKIFKSRVMSNEDEEALEQKILAACGDVEKAEDERRKFEEQKTLLDRKEHEEAKLKEILDKLPDAQYKARRAEESLKAFEINANEFSVKYEELSGMIDELSKNESELISLRQSVQKLTDEISELSNKRKSKSSDLESASVRLEKCIEDKKETERKLAESEEDENLASDIITIRHLDRDIREQEKALKKSEKELKEICSSMEENQGKRADLAQKLEQSDAGLRSIEADRFNKAKDSSLESLVERIGLIKSRIQSLNEISSIIDAIDRIHSDKKLSEQSVKDISISISKKEEAINELKSVFECLKTEVSALEISSRTIGEFLSYEDARKNLMPDMPCPLCGSKHHPYIDEHTVMESIDNRLEEKKTELDNTDRALRELDKELAVLKSRVYAENRSLKNLEASLSDKRHELSERCLESGIQSDPDISAIKVLISAAETEKSEADEIYSSVKKLDKDISLKREESSRLSSDIEKTDALIKEKALRLEYIKQSAEESEKKLSMIKSEFANLSEKYGCSVGNAVTELNNRYDARIALKKEYENLKSRASELEKKPESIKKDMEVIDAEINASEKFCNEQKARLSLCEKAIEELKGRIPYGGNADARKNSLNDEKSRIDDELHRADIAFNDLRKDLEALNSRRVEAENSINESASKIFVDMTAAECSKRIDSLNNSIKAFASDRAQQEELKKNNEYWKSERDRLESEIAALNKKAAPWKRLDDLIGSKDGKSFQSYVQGITLNILLHKANMHLKKMIPRYELAIKPDSDRLDPEVNPDELKGDSLSIWVKDKEYGGVYRTVGYLSGGEKFMASLSLALGLADMRSRSFNIGTMFIDEGFATLDGDTLDTVITVLQNLAANNISIGVISHVDALKDGIASKIEIEKGARGYSTIKGAGVSRLEEDPDECKVSRRSKK